MLVHAAKIQQCCWHYTHLYIEASNILVCKLSQVALKQEVKRLLKRASYTPQLINSGVWGNETLSPTFFIRPKTVPGLPGVCVGGPEFKTESTDSNE